MIFQTIVLIAPFDDKGNVLLLKRNDDTHCGGLWSFPGGKVEAGEKNQAAAMRELKEEAGLDATAWESLCKQSYEYPDRLLQFELFSCVCHDLSPLNTESPHVWATVDTLTDYPMPDANDAFIAAIKGRFGVEGKTVL
ncbi:NUDIX domain-containing protein [Mariprofundus sp. EBB-1]|uniref:NUDIX domain-containing protein n=1 Tax=Mariprofundus sp. EBB-1 TaxID=2650971 RepID=UPI000EF19CED|nr:NUDIX domain-containing protein [Mariprofundus sp. EBB-1]RLL53009.1 NUDIX domain-containing protein [Mariprofundus sp. EBB-1]